MTRVLLVILFTLFFGSGPLFSADLSDTHEHSSCSYCGMNRVKFAHSRMLIEYTDGTAIGTCSLHCAAIELAQSIDKRLTSVKVSDMETQDLILVDQAFWVIGGDKPGVMTSRAKWAFKSKASAQQFIAKRGGELVSFEEAIRGAYEDMYKDTQMIRKKRNAKPMQKGS